MWKADFETPPGDLEMVPNQSDSGDLSEFEDQGFQMGNEGKIVRRRGLRSKQGQCICLIAVVMALAVMAFIFVPSFGLPAWTSSSSSSSGSDGGSSSNSNNQVLENSIIDNDAYDVVLQVPVAFVEGDLIVYEHKKTRTPVMTIIPYDTEQDSVFGMAYRTKANNSHGVAHVLEHALLSGSKRFNVKDPFSQLLKGSLQTFLNAMTEPDLTSYIVASRNDVDMQNLMSVYMDALFQPLVIEKEGKWIFRQEGWRVEMNTTGEPEFNGVVLSEMRGALSNPDEVLDGFGNLKIFPNTTYRFNSGGDPKVIPDLTHQELIDFYDTFYHPSNAQVFFYGTRVSAENCLQQLDEYLDTYENHSEIREQSAIELQSLLTIDSTPLMLPYYAEDADAPHKLLIRWLISLDGIMDDNYQKENRLVFTVLDELLLNEKIGVLRKALQQSGLVGSISGGLENSMRQWIYDVQTDGVAANNTKAVEDLIRMTLQDIAKEGFHHEDIESAINTVEFAFRDISSFDYPRGIMLWFNIMQTWRYDLHPQTGFLSFESDMAALREKVKKHGSDLFRSIVENNLVNNQHAVHIDMYPEPSLARQNAEEEQSRLVRLRKSDSFPALLDEAESLSEKQVAEDPPELLAKIPSVTVADLAKKGYELPILIDENYEDSGVTVLLHEVRSSFDIIYIDFGVDVAVLDLDDIPLLPLLSKLMVDAGTESYTDVDIAREIGSTTGGISEEIVFDSILPHNVTDKFHVPNGSHFNSKLFLKGAAMREKTSNLLHLLSEVMFKAKLDSQERALSFLRETISEMETELSTGGTKYTAMRLHARYTPFKFLEEKYAGASSLPRLRKFLETAQDDWGSLLARLQKMQQAILRSNRKGMILNLTGEKAVLRHAAPLVSKFLKDQLPDRSGETALPNFATEPHPWLQQIRKAMAEESPVTNEGIVSSSSVNFVGAGAPLYKPNEAMPGSSLVVSQFVEFNNFMLQIRERRGAYGAYAVMDELTGLLLFITYRDPNLSETLEVYTSVPSYLKEQMNNASTAVPLINSAIIGTIGSWDGSAPQPSLAGWQSLLQWLHGSTPQIRQQWREDILATDNNDFLEYAMRLESWRPTLSVSGPRSVLQDEKSLDLTLIDVLS